MTIQEQFEAKVKDLIAQSKSLNLQARKNVLELLDEARKKIVGDLAALDPKSFSAAQLNVLKSSIERAMKQFSAQATAALNDFESKGFSLGAQTVAAPLQSVGLESSAFGQVSTSALSVVQGYTADLITSLSTDAAAKVNTAIQRAFLGGQQVTDIIAQVGKAIAGNKGFTGIFSGPGARAASIALNEVGRVQSMAAQARLEDAVDRHPDLQKQWIHLAIAMAPRPGHLYADEQVVPVDEPFVVDGEELMYPRDPAGSAENTINCHCIMTPYFAPDALQPSAGHKSLLDALGISVSIAA